MSDAAIKEKTGCTWERWVHALDHHGAEQMAHRDIAALVSEKYKVGGLVDADGHRRLRAHQGSARARPAARRHYEASKSRTFNVPVATLFDAWADARVRATLASDAAVKVRTATAPKSMRLGWADGSIIAVGFTAKGDRRAPSPSAHQVAEQGNGQRAQALLVRAAGRARRSSHCRLGSRIALRRAGSAQAPPWGSE